MKNSQIITRFEPEFGISWVYMNPTPRPCFNLKLLDDLQSYVHMITDNQGIINHEGEIHRIQYGVLASAIPGIFNLGGDLDHFKKCIEEQDHVALVRYGEKCIDNLYPWYRNCDLPMTSISLVQGEALGGGFEAALSASVIIAEEKSRMGFPEILFNMFPGMGAYSFLLRKIGRKGAEKLINSGEIYTAKQMYDMGIVDVLAENGKGEDAVRQFVKKHSRSQNGMQGIQSTRNTVMGITRDELLDIIEIWADTALRLKKRDLRLMEKLVKAQQKI